MEGEDSTLKFDWRKLTLQEVFELFKPFHEQNEHLMDHALELMGRASEVTRPHDVVLRKYPHENTRSGFTQDQLSIINHLNTELIRWLSQNFDDKANIDLIKYKSAVGTLEYIFQKFIDHIFELDKRLFIALHAALVHDGGSASMTLTQSIYDMLNEQNSVSQLRFSQDFTTEEEVTYTSHCPFKTGSLNLVDRVLDFTDKNDLPPGMMISFVIYNHIQKIYNSRIDSIIQESLPFQIELPLEQ